MKILVTGANGQLGSEMRIVSRSSAHEYVFTDVVDLPGGETIKLDITDLDAVRAAVKEYGVKAVVNCAAYTNVDKAETDQQSCALLNAKAPENLAVAMKEVDGLLVHISTDYVFGAEPYNTPCKENQRGTPTGVYGLTKLHGEQKIIDKARIYMQEHLKGDLDMPEVAKHLNISYSSFRHIFKRYIADLCASIQGLEQRDGGHQCTTGLLNSEVADGKAVAVKILFYLLCK